MAFVLSKISFLTDFVNKSQLHLVQLITQVEKAELGSFSGKEMLAGGRAVIYVSLLLQQTPTASAESWPSQKLS